MRHDTWPTRGRGSTGREINLKLLLDRPDLLVRHGIELERQNRVDPAEQAAHCRRFIFL
jgi:hypothetical protein